MTAATTVTLDLPKCTAAFPLRPSDGERAGVRWARTTNIFSAFSFSRVSLISRFKFPAAESVSVLKPDAFAHHVKHFNTMESKPS